MPGLGIVAGEPVQAGNQLGRELDRELGRAFGWENQLGRD